MSSRISSRISNSRVSLWLSGWYVIFAFIIHLGAFYKSFHQLFSQNLDKKKDFETDI